VLLKGEILGTVEAPDVEAAKAVAAVQFKDTAYSGTKPRSSEPTSAREGNGRLPIDHRGHGCCRVSGAAVKLDPLALLAGRPLERSRCAYTNRISLACAS